jgi:hypothetical protein
MQETIRATIQLPTRIYQLAEQHQLGQFHVLYRRRFHRFLLWFLPGWLALVIITLGYDGYRLLLSYHAPNTPSAASPFAGTWVPVWADTAQVVLTLGVIVLGALGVNPFWGFKKCLYVMENGIVYTSGKKAEIVRWDEIEAIFWWKKRGISYLCRKKGSKFRMIEEMEKAQEISTTVAGAVAEHLLPHALAHYQKTGSVRFGPLWVTREGMANFSNVASWKTVPVISWAEIEDVRFEKGKLGIKVSKQWKDWDEGIMRAYKIPNPTVCLALVRHILETVGEQQIEAIH